MNQAALALSSPFAAIKSRAGAFKARAEKLARAYPRETIGAGVLGLIGFAAIAGVANSTPELSVTQAAPPAPPPLLLKQVAPDQALQINQAIPVASGPIRPRCRSPSRAMPRPRPKPCSASRARSITRPATRTSTASAPSPRSS